MTEELSDIEEEKTPQGSEGVLRRFNAELEALVTDSPDKTTSYAPPPATPPRPPIPLPPSRKPLIARLKVEIVDKKPHLENDSEMANKTELKKQIDKNTMLTTVQLDEVLLGIEQDLVQADERPI